MHSYGKDYNRGARLIVLDESDLSTYETSNITYAETALREDSELSKMDGGISKTRATFAIAFGSFLKALVRLLGMFTMLSDKIC